ncbi:MAG: ferredoxin [Armatimonadota bacterium]
MKLSGRLRMIVAVFAGLALISAAVVATQGSQRIGAAAVVAEAEQPPCSGDCANCPAAKRANCPAAAAREQASTAPSVDAERCVGCVRCVNVAPEAFRMNSETRKAEVIAGAPAAAIERGAKACPVDAVIH